MINDDYFGKIEYENKERGIIPEKRVVLAQNLGDVFHNLIFDQKKLEELILSGAVIEGYCDVGARKKGAVVYYEAKKAYKFKKAEEEWKSILNEIKNAFNFSEVLA